MRKTLFFVAAALMAACGTGRPAAHVTTAPRPFAAAAPGPVGFAAGTTGGTNSPTVTVTSLADTGPGTLRDALAAGPANVGFVAGLAGTIQSTTVLEVPSDTTVDGTGADVTISGNGLHVGGWGGIDGQPPVDPTRNVWVRHLRFHDINATPESDAVWVSDSANGVWVDHSTFDGEIGDGSVDVTRGATNVELSWNHFVHDPVSDAGDDKTDLLGAAVPTADPPTPIVDLTVDHNWWDRTNSRNPMVRSCRCDVFDNVLDDTGTVDGGYGMKAGCGSLMWVRSDGWVTDNGNRMPLTVESGCAADRLPAALVDGPYVAGGRTPLSSRPEAVVWPQAVPVPSAEPMDQAEADGVRAAAGYQPPAVPEPTTTTTVAPTTTVPPTTTTTTVPPTTTTTLPPPPPPTVLAGVPTVTLRRAAADTLTVTWTAVAGSTDYRWTIYTCAGTLVVTNHTAGLTKPVDHLAAGCYQATVTAKVAGIVGPPGTSGQVTLP